MEEQEQNKRWITILLVIGNIIIWSIIMLFIAIAKVDAAPTTYPLSAWSVGHSGEDSGAKGNNTTFSWAWPKEYYSSAYINIIFTGYSGTTTAHARVETNLPNFCLFQTIIYNGNQPTNITTTRQCSGNTNNNMDIYFQIVSTQGQNITLQLKPSGYFNLFNSLDITAKISGSEDVELSNDLTNDTFINATNNQTTTIINNMQSNINDLKDGIINVITEQNETCEEYNYIINNLPISKDNAYLNERGEIIDSGGTNTSWKISEKIKVSKGKTYEYRKQNTSSITMLCYYKEDETLIGCYSGTTSYSLNATEKGYVKININKNTITNNATFTGTYCQKVSEQQHDDAMDILDKLQHSTPWEERTANISDFEDYEDAEDILNEYTDVDFNSVQIDLDPDTNNWVWNTLTSLINTNRLVFGMVISILSIGIIKLILNR